MKTPKNFNPIYVQEALNGDALSIMYAFWWRDTPQGFWHWSNIYTGDKRMSKRTRQYLNKLLNQAKADGHG